MAATIIFDLGGVLVHLDWDKVCAPLARLLRSGFCIAAARFGSAPKFRDRPVHLGRRLHLRHVTLALENPGLYVVG